jgi:hypothetical protein
MTNGGNQPALGPCAVAAGRQTPFVIAVDPGGISSAAALGSGNTANAQGWNVAVLPDDTFVTSGIYGASLAFGPTSFPVAGNDPNAFFARLSETTPTPAWAIAVTAGSHFTPGPIAIEDSDICTLGGYDGGGITALGTALPYVGGSDALVARLDDAGTPAFVVGFGSSDAESYFNDGSVAALGGGCVASIAAPGDVTIGSTTLLASDGPSLVAWFDGTGVLTGGYRLPSTAQLAVANGRVIAAYTVDAPVTVGGDAYTPQGLDIIVVELTPSGPAHLLGTVGGGGDQSIVSLAAIDTGVVALSLASSGDFQFGDIRFTNAVDDRVLAVLGL